MRINLTDFVRVRLNELGKRQWRRFFEAHQKYYPKLDWNPPFEDRAGWTRLHMFQLMVIFGAACNQIDDSPFVDNEIEVIEKEP